MYSSAEHFRALVEHELKCSQRYQRFSTIVVGAQRTGGGNLMELCSELLRESDEILETDSGVVIFMAEADEQNALKALGRLKKRYAGIVELAFGAAVYPRDGRKFDALVEVAQRRFARDSAKWGGAVAQGRGARASASSGGFWRLQEGGV